MAATRLAATARRLLCILFLGSAPLLVVASDAADSCEVLWDGWGVPHIYADDRSSLFYCLGWAQASSHGEDILRRYATARCRSAEYFGGEESAAQDEYYLRTGLREMGGYWYHGAPSQDRDQFDAFAAGFRDYVLAHSSRFSSAALRVIDSEAISGKDVATAWLLRWFDFCTMNLKPRLAAALAAPSSASTRQQTGGTKGSNAFAARRSGGGSFLHINPHLPWNSDIFYEVHLVVEKEGLDWYGVALVGDPSPILGFGQRAGWSHTVNYVEPYTLLEHKVRPAHDAPGSWDYFWDGAWHRFSETTYVVGMQGGLAKYVSVLRSAAGPILALDGNRQSAISFRWAANVFAQQGRSPALLTQIWDQMLVKSVDELKEVVSRQQSPFFHYIASDSAGDLFFMSNSWTPDYGRGDWDLWAGSPVPSNRSADLWQSVVRFERQPQVKSPSAGFVSNANDAPWQASMPLFLPHPAASPAWYSPPPHSAPFAARFRPKACLRAVRRAVRTRSDGATLQSMLEASMDTYSESSRHLLDPLLAAAGASSDERVARAAKVLRAWDRHYLPNSSGAVLWGRWLEHAQGLSNGATGMGGLLAGYTIPLDFMATAWQKADPLNTPAGLQDPPLALSLLGQVVSEMESDGVRLDAAWGESCKLPKGIDGRVWPGVGSPDDSVRDMWVHLRPPPGQNYSTAYGGGTFKAVVEFLPNGSRRAFVQLAYGESTMRDSRHRGDEWRLFSEDLYREALLTPADVQKHAVRRERPGRQRQVRGATAGASAVGVEDPSSLQPLLLLLLLPPLLLSFGIATLRRWRLQEVGAQQPLEGYTLVE